MPVYEYSCEGCGHDLELLVMGSAKPVCPDCGSKKLQRKFSTFAARQGMASTPSCADGGCPGSRGGKSACASGGCPFSA